MYSRKQSMPYNPLPYLTGLLKGLLSPFFSTENVGINNDKIKIFIIPFSRNNPVKADK
ncbi:MAG TPA: hypothetical protein PLA81_07445 [Syntrophorhabdaceae bacterium]|nr:hypothetical protein [Syntrophorhabdaceae bacterium]HPL41408.1 hypothetical protein [Syntrophorhabdaceae bacterium]